MILFFGRLFRKLLYPFGGNEAFWGMKLDKTQRVTAL